MSTPLLLDTCAVIWLFNRSRMSENSRKAIAEAAVNRCLYVSPFSGWEIATLAKKGRIALTMSSQAWFAFVAEHPAVTLARLDYTLLIDSCGLPADPLNDPTNRIMVATARALRLTIVTRDRAILDYASQGHVSGMEC
jgi:PIN domain nuclease of toxin-antitoxin system